MLDIAALSFILGIINQSQRESFLFFFAGRMNQRPKKDYLYLARIGAVGH